MGWPEQRSAFRLFGGFFRCWSIPLEWTAPRHLVPKFGRQEVELRTVHELYIQNENPGPDKAANWLPAPKGAFTLTMRIYSPKSEVLTGKWSPAPVIRVE